MNCPITWRPEHALPEYECLRPAGHMLPHRYESVNDDGQRYIIEWYDAPPAASGDATGPL